MSFTAMLGHWYVFNQFQNLGSTYYEANIMFVCFCCCCFLFKPKYINISQDLNLLMLTELSLYALFSD